MNQNNMSPTRKLLRLKDFDYSSEGLYFITICTESKAHYFGAIVNEQMSLNFAGGMIQYWLDETSRKFPKSNIIKYVIMPNHIHFVIHLTKQTLGCNTEVTLSSILQWFKTMTTNAYIQGVKSGKCPPFINRIWQRNYFEHIIRSESDFERIWEYIDNNILEWALDEYYEE